MSLEQVACEDLKAFERRLTEIISSAHPSAMRLVFFKCKEIFKSVSNILILTI